MAREDLITSVDDLAGFVSYVHDHFDSDNSPLKVVTTNGRKRSIPMNSTQHMWYGEISRQLIATGRLIWTPEKVKADLKRTFLGDELIEHTNMVTGEVSSAYSPRNTRDLTKGDALHYMEQINAWAANAGLILTVPNNSEYMKAKRGAGKMTNLHLGAMSLHLDNDYDYNQSNELIMVEHESYMVGGFMNSFNDFSFIAGKAFEWEGQYINYGVIVGGVTGYEYDFTCKGITPMIAPYVTLKGLPVEPVVSLFGNAITFSVRVEL